MPDGIDFNSLFLSMRESLVRNKHTLNLNLYYFWRVNQIMKY